MRNLICFVLLLFAPTVFADPVWETFPNLELPDKVESDLKSPVWGGVWDEKDHPSTETLDFDFNPLESLLKVPDEKRIEEKSELENDELDDPFLEEEKVNQIEKESVAQTDELSTEFEQITSEL